MTPVVRRRRRLAEASDPVGGARPPIGIRPVRPWPGLATAIGLALGYLVLALWETQPLAAHPADTIVGYLDASILGPWNSWWTSYALLHLHQSPYFTSYVLYPYGANLGLHTYSLVTGLLTIPLAPLLGTVLALNLVFLAGMVASGLGGAGFARYELGVSWPAAAFAGAAMTFTANVGANLSQGHYNLTTLWAIPWAFLATSYAWRTGSLRGAALAGLLIGVQGLQDLFLLSLLGLGLLVYLLVRLLSRPPTGDERAAAPRGRRPALQLLVAGAVALVVFAPEALALWAERAALGELGQDLASPSAFSPDLLSFLVPSYLNPFFAPTTAPLMERLHAADVPKVVYLGWTTLAGATVAAWPGDRARRPALRPFWAIAGAFTVLAFGPYLHAFGQVQPGGLGPISLPYAWFHALPLIRLARTPGDNVILVGFALALAASAGLDRLISRQLPMVGLGIALVAVALVAVESKTTLPVTGVADRPTFDWLAAQPPVPVLAIPAGLRDGRQGVGEAQGFVQADQIFHHHPIFGGFLARIPDAVFQGYGQDPVLAYFADPQHQSPPPGAQTRSRLVDLGVGFVLVYNAPDAPALRQYLTAQVGLTLARQEADLWLYRVPSTR
jgi:hypothetical protein